MIIKIIVSSGRFISKSLPALAAVVIAACGGGGGGGGSGANGSTPPPNPGTVAISIGDAVADEGDAGTTPLAFTVSLSEVAQDTVTATFSTAGDSATEGTDFAGASGQISFPAGTTSQTIAINVIADTLDEADESFRVSLGNLSANATILDGIGVGTIRDDDLPPPPPVVPDISVADVTVNEGDAGQVDMVFSIALSELATVPVTVDYATNAISATAGVDYTDVSGTLTFPAGATSATITVAILSDTADEPDESLALLLSNASASATIADDTGVGAIVDDDDPPVPPPPVNIAINDVSGAEGNSGPTLFRFTVALSGVAAAPVTVDYHTVALSASEGDDYTAVAGTLLLPAGTSSQILDVPVTGDLLDEPDETFSVLLSNASSNAILLDSSGVGMVQDDDASPGITITDATATEGDSGASDLSFTLALSNPSASAISVDYATADGNAVAGNDYTSAAGSVSFPPGNTSQTLTVSVLGDTLNEPDESFAINLSGVSANATLNDDTAIGTITDNDPLPALSVGDASVAEGDTGTSVLNFPVTLTPVSGQAVSVDYSTADGSATAGIDYIATSGTLTIPAGQTQASISVTINSDADNEGDETIQLSLSSPDSAVITDGQAAGTITDNDPVPGLAIADATITEGDTGSVTLSFGLTLTNPSAGTVTVDYDTTDGTAVAGADYTTISGSVTFPPGNTSQALTVSVLGDILNEAEESFATHLSNVSANAVLDDDTATGTITDNDPVPVLSVSDASVTEGDTGTGVLNFPVILTPVSGQDVSVDYSTADGSATAGSDYAATSGTLTIPAGQTQVLVSVTINADVDNEGDETIQLTLGSPDPEVALLGDAAATGTIIGDDSPPTFGLDERPSNTTCLAPARPTAGASAATEDPFPTSPGFNRITKILQAPGDGSRWFVLEQPGLVQVFNVADPANPATYLDISASVRNVGNEEGLLGMAFHPSFPTTPEIFLYYTAGSSDATRHSRISRFILDDPATPVAVTEEILLTVDQPRNNHNGGEIGFGPDDYLYIGLGDGGGDGDTFDNAQDTTRLLGSMLRLDVLGVPFPVPGYQVPADNPFAGNPQCGPTDTNADNCPEIYAWGLRNPWRWSFDAPTGQLWLADVGEVGWEEVDIIERGGNYGWDCREGAHDFELAGCPAGGLIDPVFEYQRGIGWAITGGYVYRNTTIPGLAGRYVFGDYGSGRIWALQPDGQGGYLMEQLIDTPWQISTFGLGVDGELYFTDFANGRIQRLIPAGPGNPDTIPDNLVDTGCVDTLDPTLPAAGLIPYTINAPFWSDNAVKSRWMALPDGTTIDIDASDDFVFPNGSVLVKNFELGGQLIETRLLMRHPDGFWGGYTYEWNDTVTAATRVKGGKTRAVAGQQWIYPSEGECLNCHTSAAGLSLGPELAQLNGELSYASTGVTANQLDTLDHILVFTSPLPGPAATLPAMPDPADSSAPLAERARAYLHTNCSQCHRPAGPTPSGMDLRYPTAFPATNTCDVVPVGNDLNIGPTARLIVPGDSGSSVIPARMNRRDAHGMPPLGSDIADGVGVSLIDAWIDSLPDCN